MHDLIQVTQFLKFMGGSNSTHANSNYLANLYVFYLNKYGTHESSMVFLNNASSKSCMPACHITKASVHIELYLA